MISTLLKRTVAWGLILVVVLVGLGFATRDERSRTKVLVATKALPRYAVVQAGDVAEEMRHVPDGDVVEAPELAVGKALLAPVANGGLLSRSQLVDTAFIQGRVSVTVAVTASPDAPEPGKVATLIVSPRNEVDGGVVVRGVRVLAVTKGKDATTYTVGVTDGQLQELAPLLGFSDVRVVSPSLR